MYALISLIEFTPSDAYSHSLSEAVYNNIPNDTHQKHAHQRRGLLFRSDAP